MLTDQIKQQFSSVFHKEPEFFVRSPGRVNLIGEHTDYNEGYVLPAAIDKSIYLAFARNTEQVCRVYSLDYSAMDQFTMDKLAPRNGGWLNFIMGVADQFQKRGMELGGFDCVFGGDIPIGAGLSSSAALENGAGMGLARLFGHKVDKSILISISQMAEHEFAGVMCGIMDMFASMMGKKDLAIRLDCRSLQHDYFPLNLGSYQFLLLDTKVTHSLGDSEYNIRRKECENGTAILQQKFPGVKSLRDVTLSMLQESKEAFSPTVWDRCSYVVEENQRLLKACECLENTDLTGFGSLMYGSHEGLRHKYEVSCPELDFLVDFTLDRKEVLGARMMGGGFGGCTINLIASESVDTFVEEISHAYHKNMGRQLSAYSVNISDGTEILENGEL
jgi:galactokinase